MSEITMKNLETSFNNAKELGEKFVAVRIEMDGFPEVEIIINPIVNADSKLAYYKKTCNEDLSHKHAPGIRIVGCTFGQSMSEIEEDFAWL